MSEDNRKRPCILRVLPTVDARVRAYAARQGLAPNVAAEALINGAAGEIAALDKQLVALRADLESAREATRRADAEVERLTRELTISEENTAAAVRLVERREKELAEVRAALATKGATERLAERLETIAADVPKIPRKLMARVKARIKARPNANPPRDFAFVLSNGCDRLEASDRYQDKVKAENAAKRAAKGA